MVWNKGTKGICKSNSTSFKKGLIPWNKGKKGVMPTPWNKGISTPPRHTTPHTEETKLKCSLAQKKRWEDGIYKNKKYRFPKELVEYANKYARKGKFIKCIVCGKEFFCSPSYIKNGRKYCSKECQGIDFSLEKHPNWKGGISRKHKLVYNSKGYSKWRRFVFIRDEFTCKKCGQKSIYMEAHHIKPFSKFPDLRFNIDNGLTLCKNCHRKIHRRIYVSQ